jgi:hypothetical protein
MSAWDGWIGIAAALLPQEQRSTWKEQWRADMRDAHEVGMSRAGIALSMFAFAAVGSPGHRASGARLGLAIVLAAVAAATMMIIPALVLVYFTLVLFAFSLIGARLGLRELSYTATGVVIAAGGITASAAILSRAPSINPSIAISAGVVLLGVGLAVASFALALSRSTARPVVAWLTSIAGGLAASSLFISATAAVLGAAAGDALGPADTAPGVIAAMGTLAVVSFTLSVISTFAALGGIVKSVSGLAGARGSLRPR